ncbi:MAG: hypothetical protein JNK89_10145, partial [Saprospiraceae bacterium]|nr:hypothetical protein [Saprospiraceae bacterium]
VLLWQNRELRQANRTLQEKLELQDLQSERQQQQPAIPVPGQSTPVAATPGKTPATAAPENAPAETVAPDSRFRAPRSNTPAVPSFYKKQTAPASGAPADNSLTAAPVTAGSGTADAGETPGTPAGTTPVEAAGVAAPSAVAAEPATQAAWAGLAPAPTAALPEALASTRPPAGLVLPWPAPTKIKPFQERKQRFQLGLEGLAAAAQPRESGVSWLKGIGVSAGYAPLRNLWLTAGVDWRSYSVQRMELLPKKYFHHDPPKPQQHGNQKPELVDMKGEQRQQVYSLGLRYVVPLRFPVRPAVHLSHQWLRQAPALYVFSYDDHDPGHPNPKPHDLHQLAERIPGFTASNIWSMGVSLEYDTPAWVFRAGVDWQEGSLATPPTFDALVLRAGLAYKL